MSEGTPARGYSWPPFESGNTVAQKHGAYSPRKVDPLAAELFTGLLAVAEAEGMPYLHQAAYRPAMHAWARAEAQVQLITEWIMEHGVLDPDGAPRSAADLLLRFEKHAASLRARLGLDPLSRARLGRDVAAQNVDLARLFAEQARDAELSREVSEGDGVDDGDG